MADRYRVIRRVGEGGFSSVFLVDDTMVSEEVILDFIRNKYFISGYKSRVNEKMGKQPIPVTHGILQGTLAFLLEQINQSWGQIFIRIDSHNKLLILRRLSVLYFE